MATEESEWEPLGLEIVTHSPTTHDDSPTSLTRRFRTRARTLWSQLTPSEVSGSFGDLGTFIPLLVALGQNRSIHVVPSLFAAGLANAVTGWVWDVPMPVQPMKSIAAVALVDQLSRSQVTAAGVWMGVFLTLLGATSGMECIQRIVPRSVVSGMQVGVGMSLAMHGLHMVTDRGWVDGVDCSLLGLACAVASLFLLREDSNQRHWVGLYLFGIGALLAIVSLMMNSVTDSDPKSTSTWQPIFVWALSDVSFADWRIGLLDGALPQLPLSTLNSVISVCCLADTLYPEKRRGSPTVLTRREVCLSVGLMNLLLCPLGAMPHCHGAGGLAGQHKLGARHGASIVFLGMLKMILALFLSPYILPLLDAIPKAILGVLLMIAALELATTGWRVLNDSSSVRWKMDAMVSLTTAMVILGLHKTHYGAMAGLLVHGVYGDGVQQWRAALVSDGPASHPTMREMDEADVLDDESLST